MTSLSDRIYCIALASLFHDIGKPLQRAEKSDKNTNSKNTGSIESPAGDACSLCTSDFLSRNREIFEKIPEINRYGFEAFRKLASKHEKHDSDSIDEQIIQAADRASTGIDSHYDKPEDHKCCASRRYIYKPLVSLFTQVKLDDENGVTQCCEPKHYNLGNIKSNAVMPGNFELSSEKYSKLFEEFKDDFKRIPTENSIVFLESVTTLITRYFWCVPSSTTEEYEDIPLCDHLVTTAAIASAMAVACYETGCKCEEGKYLFVSGDFSGIQKFIFALTGESNRSIAKLLRGRSFMVNLYNMLCARMITDSCGLPPLNTISAAGGKFKVLLPDTPKTKEVLTKTREQVENWIFEKFYGELRFLVDSGVSFEYDDFRPDRFKDVLRRSAVSLNREKSRQFYSILGNKDKWVDNERYKDFQKNRLCPICGKEPGNNGNDSEMKPGNNCRIFIETGRDLYNYKIISIYDNDEKGIFSRFGVSYHSDKKAAVNGLHSCYEINVYDREENKVCDREESKEPVLPELHYACYVPEAEPGDDEENCGKESDKRKCVTFENIAADGEGIGALAVFKADIDNLGLIFSDGFRDNNGKRKMSISRSVALSRMINWFFAGYLPAFINKNDKYKNIYTLFAGGDDLCLIGRWDTMIEFAIEIQKEFNKYTGNTPAITISAGVELFKPGFPVSRAVANAEKVLDRSKTGGKNCITLLGHTMKWGDELKSQMDFAENWQKFVKQRNEDNGANCNSMLYRFLSYHKEWADAKKNNDIMGSMKHRFRFIYDINRNLKPKKDEKMDWRTMKPFRQLIITKTPDMDDSPVFKYLPVGVTCSIYSNRKNDMKEVK